MSTQVTTIEDRRFTIRAAVRRLFAQASSGDRRSPPGMFDRAQNTSIQNATFTINNYGGITQDQHAGGEVSTPMASTPPDDATPSSSRQSHDVYVDFLLTKEKGYPLWFPSPDMSLPVANRIQGIALGDVGIINAEGGFDFLFNVFHDATHDINTAKGVPQGFIPFQSRPEMASACRTEWNGGTYLGDHSVSRLDSGGNSLPIKLGTTAPEAAILMMPQDVRHHRCLSMTHLRAYIAQNIASWYNFVINVLGYEISNGGLRVVYGCHKTPSFGIAVAFNSGASHAPVTQLTFSRDSVRASGYPYRWHHTGLAETKVGPSLEEAFDFDASSTDRAENQCLFVSTIDTKVSSDIWKQIAGVHVGLAKDEPVNLSANLTTQLPDTSTQASADNTASQEGRTLPRSQCESVFHPSAILHDILETMVPGLPVYMIATDDWAPLIKDKDMDVQDFVRGILSSNDIIECSGTAYFRNRNSDEGDPDCAAEIHFNLFGHPTGGSIQQTASAESSSHVRTYGAATRTGQHSHLKQEAEASDGDGWVDDEDVVGWMQQGEVALSEALVEKGQQNTEKRIPFRPSLTPEKPSQGNYLKPTVSVPSSGVRLTSPARKLPDAGPSSTRAVNDSLQRSRSVASEDSFQWIKGNMIGKGRYAKVYIAFNATSGDIMAVKQVELPKTGSDRTKKNLKDFVEALRSERQTLRVLEHENIVQYLGFEENKDTVNVFLEYVSGGTIGGCYRKCGRLREDVIQNFTRQILRGLEYLHSQGIIHRDMKSDNILVQESGVCKISDFAISKKLDFANRAHTGLRGTSYWMAPEILNPGKNGFEYDSKVDIWSLGCVVVEMWTARRPWPDEFIIFSIMLKLKEPGTAPPLPDDLILSKTAEHFRQECFTHDQKQRPRASDLLNHPYVEAQPDWAFPGLLNLGESPSTTLTEDSDSDTHSTDSTVKSRHRTIKVDVETQRPVELRENHSTFAPRQPSPPLVTIAPSPPRKSSTRDTGKSVDWMRSRSPSVTGSESFISQHSSQNSTASRSQSSASQSTLQAPARFNKAGPANMNAIMASRSQPSEHSYYETDAIKTSSTWAVPPKRLPISSIAENSRPNNHHVLIHMGAYFRGVNLDEEVETPLEPDFAPVRSQAYRPRMVRKSIKAIAADQIRAMDSPIRRRQTRLWDKHTEEIVPRF